MELGQGFYLFSGLILLLGLVSLVGNIQLVSFYRHKLAQLQAYEGKVTTDEVTSSYNRLMDEIINEYKLFRSQGIEQINTQALIEHKVYQQHLSLLGILRLPVGVFERIIYQIPSWTIILGLLGTFIGLTLALFAMQSTLFQFSTSSSTEIVSISTIIQAISEPFKGMSFAFLTSIAGIGVAFLIHVTHSGILSKLGLGSSYVHLKQLFFTRLESYLDHHVQLQVQTSKPQDYIERLLDRLVEKVKESFEQSVANFGNEIVLMTNKLEESVQGLREVIDNSAKFTAEFHQGTGELSAFGQTIKTAISTFQGNEQLVAGRIEQLTTHMKNWQRELQQLSSKNIEGQKSLERLVERSDQVIQQSLRKSEEMFRYFHELNEEVSRRFSERFDEYQRQNQAMQEDLHYRLEQSFRNQHAGQDRELRELIRGIEGIAHLLEREFQILHRFAGEMTHILDAMYEWNRSQVVHARKYTEEEAIHTPVVRERRY